MPSTPTSPFAVALAFAAAVLGRPVCRWSPTAEPLTEPPVAYRLSPDITLWRLPIGAVRVRERHRALEAQLSKTTDSFRFPLMMADSRISEWLPCCAWLISHPEGVLLVDTGESPTFGQPAYFAGVDPFTARLYPKIIDARTRPEFGLEQAIAATGHSLSDIQRCILTHLHSDHVGNAKLLGPGTRVLVNELEIRSSRGTGRLPELLPSQFGRVESISLPAVGSKIALTRRQDIWMVATPGHTAGHSSVLINLAEQDVLIAGDAAFTHMQVVERIVPGISEDLGALLQTYHWMEKKASEKPTVFLYTHDPLSAQALAGGPVEGGPFFPASRNRH